MWAFAFKKVLEALAICTDEFVFNADLETMDTTCWLFYIQIGLGDLSCLPICIGGDHVFISR